MRRLPSLPEGHDISHQTMSINTSTLQGSTDLTIFSPSENNYEASPGDIDVSSQMVEVSSESRTTDSSLLAPHGLPNDELYACIHDTATVSNNFSIIGTADKGRKTICHTLTDQAVLDPGDNPSNLNIEDFATSESQSTKRLEAVALGPLHGESYTSFSTRNSNNISVHETVQKTNVYESLPGSKGPNHCR